MDIPQPIGTLHYMGCNRCRGLARRVSVGARLHVVPRPCPGAQAREEHARVYVLLRRSEAQMER